MYVSVLCCVLVRVMVWCAVLCFVGVMMRVLRRKTRARRWIASYSDFDSALAHLLPSLSSFLHSLLVLFPRFLAYFSLHNNISFASWILDLRCHLPLPRQQLKNTLTSWIITTLLIKSTLWPIVLKIPWRHLSLNRSTLSTMLWVRSGMLTFISPNCISLYHLM